MTSKLVNDTFILYSVLMEATTPAAFTWGLKIFNTAFPPIFNLHQEPDSDSAPHVATPDIILNIFQHFLSALKLSGIKK